jgi:murein L,D-transpeptidase YcbB/YkuD
MGNPIRITGLFMALLICISNTLFAYNKPEATDKAYAINPELQSQLLQKALDRYYEIQRNGGWTKINATKKHYIKGQSDAAITQLKKRLRASGDFNSEDDTPLFTDELVAAVKKVQKRFGFPENGVADAQLIKQLNIPIEERIRQLEINLERLQSVPVSPHTIQLVANIPEFKLHVYEGGTHVFDMNIVVGSESNKTVIFNDEMTHIVFSPYWNVPQSIVRNEILPAMRRNRNYLSRNGYEKIGEEDGLPVIRQKPGPGNALGLVKFVFPNNHAIYFHDTPAKGLFQLRKRAFSHGCIRLAEPAKLAQYLLRNQSEWSDEKIKKAMHSGKEQPVTLKEPVGVALTYFTAWVDKDELVHFREDVYGLDKKEAIKIAKTNKQQERVILQ